MDAAQVLRFWFDRDRKDWFEKNPAFDAEIRERFLGLYEQAAQGKLAHWQDDARGCVALVILLDQFPRNMFRGEARAFSADDLARQAARTLLARGWDLELSPSERMFAYLPFEHSESLADQLRCCELMQALTAFPETQDIHGWAVKHRDIIQRFGRFPHRNAALERASTPEEIEFLKQPGSSF